MPAPKTSPKAPIKIKGSAKPAPETQQAPQAPKVPVPPGMQVVMEHYTSLSRYENNPRRNAHAVPVVARSLAEFGWRQPIVVDKPGGKIVVGDTRFQAAVSLIAADEKWQWIPVVYATDLTPAQVTAYRLADNRVGEVSEWDDAKLMTELGLIMEEGFDLDGMGFTKDELSFGVTLKEKKEDLRYLEDFEVMPTPKPRWILISAPEDEAAAIIGTVNAMGLANTKLEYSGDPNVQSAKHPDTPKSSAKPGAKTKATA